MNLFVEIIYLIITVVLILVVLLQAGRGGGMGTALGGGASQSVFGGSGGADFLAKLTQGLAIGFMVCAVYLAYASAHTGSDRLKEKSEELAEREFAADGEDAVEYIGPNPLRLPPASAAPESPGAGADAPSLEPIEGADVDEDAGEPADGEPEPADGEPEPEAADGEPEPEPEADGEPEPKAADGEPESADGEPEPEPEAAE